MTDLLPFADVPADGVGAVGGKALSLARLAAAGLPVPPGFCLTTHAFRRLRGQGLAADPALRERLAAAYEALGGGPVAVRSSATAEDGSVTSFAGQQETVLGAVGAEAVCAAVERCWESLDSERAVAYRQHHGIAADDLAMAVVVQRLVPAGVSGVLFTHDPMAPDGKGMLVEASWGLGESVVSGKVTPDRFHLEPDTGKVREAQVAVKKLLVGPNGEEAVPEDRQSVPCLDAGKLAELAELGRRVEALYGEPRDVEWAWGEGRFWLLQARPITALGAAEREQVRREEIAALRARAAPEGTVWSRCNLAESLPAPTPMTWAVVRRFMSGRGGYGLMHRDLGFRPDPSLDDDCAYDVIAGRTYCNLSREPLFYPGWVPYEHPFAALKADPARALNPQPVRNPARARPLTWLLLPALLPFKVIGGVRFALRLANLSRTFHARYRQEIAPAFLASVAAARAEDWGKLDGPALAGKLEEWTRRALYDFAREALKPTALAAVALANLERGLKRKLGPERTKAALGELTMGVRPDPGADLPGAIADLAAGRLGQADFLAAFGHRGDQEMELSEPRWAEEPAALALQVRGASGEARPAPAAGAWERLAAEAKLSALDRATLTPEAEALSTYLGLRETAKHHLMAGYALIRRALVELDRRHRLHGGVFYLTPEELPRLLRGEDVSGLIAQRRRRRAVAVSLEAPAVLFSDDPEALGRPEAAAPGADVLRGVGLSAGVAEGPALVLERLPEGEGPPPGPYVLVCPSTNPAWVPLFLRARALVMETGGVLSHGAIVARELGLPAVAGLPGAPQRLRSGQRLRVDGGAGTVTVLPG
jgi:pyruvate,water dikinase